MNVVHVRSCGNQGGGPEKTIRLSCIDLIEAGHQCSAVYLHGNTQDPLAPLAKLQACEVPSRAVDLSGPLDVTAISAVRAALQEYDRCLLHAHDYKSEIVGLLAARGMRKRVALVTTLHGVILNGWKTRLYNALANQSRRFYDAVVAVAHSQLPYLARTGVSKTRIQVIHNAIRLEDYAADVCTDADTSDDEFSPIPQGTKTVLVLGRLAPEKRGDMALRVLQQLSSDLPIYLLFVGTGPCLEQLRRMARDLGVRDRVRFVGYQEDVRPFIRVSDVLLVTSKIEGLPNSVLEAQAMGVPVVASAVDGVPEIIENGHNGFLVSGHALEQYVGGIDRLLGDAGLRERITRNARRRIEAQFSFSNRMSIMIGLYERLYAEKGWT
jgi:glycosyltransferase involved in cell wall biosynthesis